MPQTKCLHNMIRIKAAERWSNSSCTDDQTHVLLLQTLDEEAGSTEEQQHIPISTFSASTHFTTQCTTTCMYSTTSVYNALPPACILLCTCALLHTCTLHYQYHHHLLYHLHVLTTCRYLTLPPACTLLPGHTLPTACTWHYHLHVHYYLYILYHQHVLDTINCMYITTCIYLTLPAVLDITTCMYLTLLPACTWHHHLHVLDITTHMYLTLPPACTWAVPWWSEPKAEGEWHQGDKSPLCPLLYTQHSHWFNTNNVHDATFVYCQQLSTASVLTVCNVLVAWLKCLR